MQGEEDQLELFRQREEDATNLVQRRLQDRSSSGELLVSLFLTGFLNTREDR